MTLKHACDLFGVKFELDAERATGNSEAARLLYLISAEIEKRKIEALYDRIGGGVVLDDKWRDKVRSYLTIVREMVYKAEIPEPIRERIIEALHQLEREVDQTRTRVEKFRDTLVAL